MPRGLLCTGQPLDTTQLNKLQRLKSAMADVPAVAASEHLLIRYLYAREFKVTKAEERLRTLVNRAEAMDVTGPFLQRWTPPQALSYFPVVQHGVTKLGGAVFWWRVGRMDCTGLRIECSS